jgi:phage gp29-like protein
MARRRKRATRVENPFDRAWNALRQEEGAWDTTTSWTPTDVTTAISNADLGELETAADICDSQWSDDRIRGTLQTRVAALLGLNNDEKLEFSSESVRISKAIAKDWWISAPESELFKLIRWGLHLGVGVAQRRVVESDGRWVPRLETWHPRALTYSQRTQRWSIRTYEGTIEIDPADPSWVMFLPYGSSRPWGEGTWKSCSLYWLIKTSGLRSWAKHNELHGSGGLKGKAPASASPQDLQSFWAQLKAMGRNARIVLPDGYDISVLEAAAATWNTFPAAIDKADTGIAIIHLGQPMTTEVPKSAQTGADNARAVRQDYLEFDAENLSTWMHDRHLPAWAEWNFGSASLAPWGRFNVSPPINLQIEANTLAALGGAIEKLNAVAPTGWAVDSEVMFKRYNVPLARKPVESVEPPPPPVAPPPAVEPPEDETEETETEDEVVEGEETETVEGEEK